MSEATDIVRALFEDKKDRRGGSVAIAMADYIDALEPFLKDTSYDIWLRADEARCEFEEAVK